MKVKVLIKAGVIVLIFILLGSTNVFAAESDPTIDDAHELIADLINGGLVTAGPARNVYSKYSGNRCISSMIWGEKGGATQIDWAGISSVVKLEEADGIGVRIFGMLTSTMPSGTTTDKYKQASFHVIDEATRRRLEKAMTLLINSCAKKSRSKFD